MARNWNRVMEQDPFRESRLDIQFQTNKKAASMDNLCELKLSIFSVMHRIIDRALYLEQAIEGLLGVLSQAVPHSTAAIIISAAPKSVFSLPRPAMIRTATRNKGFALFIKPGSTLFSAFPSPLLFCGIVQGPCFSTAKLFIPFKRNRSACSVPRLSSLMR